SDNAFTNSTSLATTVGSPTASVTWPTFTNADTSGRMPQHARKKLLPSCATTRTNSESGAASATSATPGSPKAGSTKPTATTSTAAASWKNSAHHTKPHGSCGDCPPYTAGSAIPYKRRHTKSMAD